MTEQSPMTPENIHASFISWCQRTRVPRELRKATDMVSGFLNIVREGGSPNPELKIATAKAAAQIETWKAAA